MVLVYIGRVNAGCCLLSIDYLHFYFPTHLETILQIKQRQIFLKNGKSGIITAR